MIGDAPLSLVHVLRIPAGGTPHSSVPNIQLFGIIAQLEILEEETAMLTRRSFVACASACLPIVGACLLAGCSSATPEPETDDNLPVLVVGTGTYPPFSYLDENGNPSGIDVDILTEACKRLGYVPDFQYIGWENKFELLESGAIDMIACCFSMTDREDKYRWAGSYMQGRQVIAVVADSDIQTLADLADKVVAVQSASTSEKVFLDDAVNGLSLSQVGLLYCLQDRSLLYPMLAKGYVDAIAGYDIAIRRYMADYGMDFRILDEPLQTVNLGFAFALDDSRGIDARLDDVLSEMYVDGTLESIASKYLPSASSFLGVDAHDC